MNTAARQGSKEYREGYVLTSSGSLTNRTVEITCPNVAYTVTAPDLESARYYIDYYELCDNEDCTRHDNIDIVPDVVLAQWEIALLDGEGI